MDLQPQLETLLVAQVRKVRRQLFWGGLGGFGIMGLVAACCYLFLTGRDRGLWVMATGVGVLLLGLCVPSLLDPARAKPLRMLREHGEKIVWLYLLKRTGQGAGVDVVCGLEDGQKINVPCQLGKADGSEQEVFRALCQLAPRAARGFTPELERRFSRDPASLRARA